MKQLAGNSSPRSAGQKRATPPRRRAAVNNASSALTFVEPMLAKSVTSPPSGEWLYEMKFDGFRAQALKHGQKVALRSRNDKDFGKTFPEIVQAIATIDAGDVILDGEIVALDPRGRPSFQLLQASELGQERPPLFFYAFDLLRLEDRSLLDEPITTRKAALEQLLKSAPSPLRYSASLDGNAKTLLAKAGKLGLEGLIGKRKDSIYAPGKRSGAWVKLKLHCQQEMVIGGYTDPERSRKYFGALLVGFHHHARLRFAGKVGTGFDAKSLRAVSDKLKPLRQPDCPFVNLPEKQAGRFSAGLTAREMRRCHWVRPQLVCQVKFSEWTRDGKLRHPVFLGLRDDKPAKGVVREPVAIV